MHFKPNMELLTTWGRAERPGYAPPYIAVFRARDKTLVYCATAHGAHKSFEQINYCFHKWDFDCAVVEVVRDVDSFGRGYLRNELEYAGGVAATMDVPVVLADVPKVDVFYELIKRDAGYLKPLMAEWVLKNARNRLRLKGMTSSLDKEIANFKHFMWRPNMGEIMTADEFMAWFFENFNRSLNPDNISDVAEDAWFRPSHSLETVFNRMHADLNLFVRDPFMLKNIFAAMNKYDTVFATFGEGHFRAQRCVLEHAFGAPEYISDVGASEKINLDDARPNFKVLI